MFRIDALKICAVRETLEESGIWPLSGHIKTFNYSKDNFEKFIIVNNIQPRNIINSKIYPWMNWRTPNCIKIYSQQWDMQLFVSILTDSSVNKNHISDEAVEIIWINIKDALKRAECDDMILAPPQWFILKEIDQYRSDAEFVNAVLAGKYPTIIQPKLVGSENSDLWHSILYKDRFFNDPNASIHNMNQDKGPFHRIIMKRANGYFHKF